MSITDDKTITEASGAKLTAITIREPDRLHKQSRGLQKTIARLAGKDTENPQGNLFVLPTYQSDTNPYKDTLTKNTGILAQYLFALWQAKKNSEGYYRIENLTQTALELGWTSQDLKTYFICLGGYQYPITKFDKGKGIMTLYTDKIFKVKFNINLNSGETENSFTNDDRIGTNLVSFIKSREVASIDIEPSNSFIEDYNGRGLGNVFVVSDGLTAYCLGLSLLAYKIFCFSGSNKPSYKIGFDKLIESLNLSRQLKTNGKPRILKNIEKALNELQTTGHLTNWAFDKKAELYSWTYTNKIIRHKELLPKKEQPAGETDKTGQDRQGRPDREDRRDTPETTKEK